MTEPERERLIRRCYAHLVGAQDRDRKRYWYRHMVRLLRSRPPEKVFHMERARGLR